MSTKTVLIDGRELVITDKSTKRYRYLLIDGKTVDFVEKIIESAVRTCKTFRRAAFFPRIKILIKDKGPGQMQAICTESLIVVYLSTCYAVIQESMKESRSYDLRTHLDFSFEHEITHLYHEKASGYLSLKNEIYERTYVKAASSIPRHKAMFREWYAIWRSQIQDLFMRLLSEGVAIYIAEFGEEKILFDEKEFGLLHQRAMDHAYRYIAKFEEISNEKNVNAARKKVMDHEEEIDNIVYDIGMHMIYAILYFNKNMKLEDIFKMKKYHKF